MSGPSTKATKTKKSVMKAAAMNLTGATDAAATGVTKMRRVRNGARTARETWRYQNKYHGFLIQRTKQNRAVEAALRKAEQYIKTRTGETVKFQTDSEAKALIHQDTENWLEDIGTESNDQCIRMGIKTVNDKILTIAESNLAKRYA